MNDEKGDLLRLVTTFQVVNIGELFAREQLLGQIRGVEWVREQVTGTFARLQQETKTESPE